MTTQALIIPTTELKPHPPAHGELQLRKGAWDQLQASKAYQETLCDCEARASRQRALDFRI